MLLKLFISLLPLLFFSDGGGGGANAANGDGDERKNGDGDGSLSGTQDDYAELKTALAKERKDRETAQSEAKALRGLRKELDDLKQSIQQRKDADAAANGEWEKVAGDREKAISERDVEIERLKAQIADRDLTERKRTLAKKAGLPESMISRMQGATDEELEADAKELAKHLKAPEADDHDDAGATTKRDGRKSKQDAAYKNPSYWGI